MTDNQNNLKKYGSRGGDTPSIHVVHNANDKRLPFILLFVLSLASCASMNIETGAIRTVPALIGLDGVSQDKAEGLVKRFNEEAVEETGIVLDASYIPFSMKKQKEIWPKCKDPLFCFADYTTINHNWKGKGIAIYLREATAGDYIQRVLIGGKIGETDTTKYQYIALYTTDYDAFKHEIYHVFQYGHSLIGGMFAVRDIMGIPIATSTLSDSAKREIIKNKWRSWK